MQLSAINIPRLRILREIATRGTISAAAEALWITPSTDVRLTLVSCWPYSSNTQRLIVIALPLPTATTGKP